MSQELQTEEVKEETVSFNNDRESDSPLIKGEPVDAMPVADSIDIEDSSLEREELARLERIAAEIVVK